MTSQAPIQTFDSYTEWLATKVTNNVWFTAEGHTLYWVDYEMHDLLNMRWVTT